MISAWQNEIDMALTFGEWLRSKRGMKGDPGFITQDELARRMKVARTFVVQLESPGHPTPTYPTRKKIHAALGTTEDELIALGIVQGRGARLAPVQAVTAASPPSARADAFIATLSRAQRDMLRRLLDEADRPRPGDEDEQRERVHGT